ncbi:protein POLLEN DEFECTIVE IN GUIDANCE 1 [Mercurialis annua]|uniref:protein POLLEN DEFECTIVE IN GUIDANCE 1 n=1 Tax=Mercurialis annua TaxID=3986 RepID=UPI00216006DC|nr:protein POLLEN DEFECTIVE IN GUIDANCE 1 [Mercurialis annua]
MALIRSIKKNLGRKLSFEILSETGSSNGDDDEFLLDQSNSVTDNSNGISKPSNRRKKKHKKKKPPSPSVIPEDPIDGSFSDSNLIENGDGRHDFLSNHIGGGSSTVCSTVSDVPEILEFKQSLFNHDNRRNSGGGSRELRQRNVSFGGDESVTEEKSSVSAAQEVITAPEKERSSEPVVNGNVDVPMAKLEPAESLDWNLLLAQDPNFVFTVDKSPVKYLMDEMYKGNSLRSTSTLGSEKERQKVYDTIFRLPWRCELLIDVGFFVCLDSFLSLLTIMPTRIFMILWRFYHTRQFKKPSAAELSDIGCLIVLASGVALLGRTDISLIYHMIRGQGTIKLYVVYNVLEIFDRLCQSFGGDVMETLFNSAEGMANCSEESTRFWIWRFICDQALAMAFSILHSFILLVQAITLSVCIVAHNNALMALLVSNNFAEIKSNVFKRFSKDNIHSLVYADSVERFHISAFLLFVLAQNILEAEGPWFESFLINAMTVFLCEMLIDIIKHSFLAKFNDIKPISYSEFLEELCNQTLDIQTGGKKKQLTFIPLAPACVVIRVLTPVYAAHLPCSPFAWRFFWILLLCSMTYVMLTSLKVMIGMGLQKHATWYVNRCRKRKLHFHYD